MSILSRPYFHDEAKAFEHLESQLWVDGVICPHCGTVGTATKLHGEKHRLGVWKCNEKDCRKQFTVKVGTVFEHGRMPLHKMLQAVYLMSSSKKGISAHQLHRTLDITYKSAWFLAHRIREAMVDGKLLLLGGEGKTVEADETFIGGKEKNRHRSKRAKSHLGGSWGKETVFSLVERKGTVRSLHVASVTAENLRAVMKSQIDGKSFLCTDDAGQYRHMSRDFSHEVVNHSAEEYVRGEAHTNTVEGYFSLLKRGITGCYFHVSPAHLHRYLAEFDFRYNHRQALGCDDLNRTASALKGMVGKRLLYRDSRAV
jgi:transposase-like protein